jgi:peptidoglycan/xylan/chitin deacetylase (PgdA/CDA1 family)
MQRGEELSFLQRTLSRPLIRQQLKNAVFVGMGVVGSIGTTSRVHGSVLDGGGMLRVLMYHRVNRPRIDAYTIPPGRLQRHLALLRDRYEVVSPDIVLRSIEGRSPLPDRAVLLTFDDAYRDHYENAYPLLRDLGLQALLFVPTDHISDRGTGKGYRHVDTSSQYPALDWADLREMQDVFTIGSHGMSHQMLTELPRTEAAVEIVESKRLLEERLGVTVSFFSYPYGTPEAYDQDLETLVRAAGYRASFVTVGGLNSPEYLWSGSALRRHGVESLSEFALARVLDGSCDLVQGTYIRYRQWAASRRRAAATPG